MENCEHGRPVHYVGPKSYRNLNGVDYRACWCCGEVTGLKADESDDPVYCDWCNPAGGPPLGVNVSDSVKAEDKVA